MLAGFLTRIIGIVAVFFAPISPSAAGTVNYELTFNALLGPSGTGSFSYEDTPGAEWMSDVALDFGSGYQGVVHMAHDPAVTGENYHLFLFEIFSDTSPYGPGYHQSLALDSYEAHLGIWPVLEGDGFNYLEFAKYHYVKGPNTPFIHGPFYVFSGPDIPGYDYYGTIELSQATAAPLPAAFPLLASALLGMTMLATVRRKSRHGETTASSHRS